MYTELLSLFVIKKGISGFEGIMGWTASSSLAKNWIDLAMKSFVVIMLGGGGIRDSFLVEEVLPRRRRTVF